MASVPDPQSQANAVENVQGEFTFANRAPNSKDKGLFWVNDKGATVDFYIRSKKSGAWKGPTTLS